MSSASASPMSFDYESPAELFLAKRSKHRRKNHRRFATAAEAIRYAVEDLRTPKALGEFLDKLACSVSTAQRLISGNKR